MTYLLLPAGGAAGPRISTTENILIPVSVFDAQRQKQNESSGVKKFRQCTSCGCSSHPPAALYWFSSSTQLCSRMDVCRRSCGWTQPSVFCVPPSWCEGTAHTWNICLILHSSSKEFDICLMSLFFSLSKHCPSSLLLVFFFFFPVSTWISPESQWPSAVLRSSSIFNPRGGVLKKDVFVQLKLQNFSSLDSAMKANFDQSGKTYVHIFSHIYQQLYLLLLCFIYHLYTYYNKNNFNDTHVLIMIKMCM